MTQVINANMKQASSKKKNQTQQFSFNTFTGTGQYVFAESSSPAATGMHALLKSKLMPQTKSRLMTFWYHMHGLGIGKLSVIMHATAGTTTVLWKKSGDLGDVWLNATVEIRSDQDYYVCYFY